MISKNFIETVTTTEKNQILYRNLYFNDCIELYGN